MCVCVCAVAVGMRRAVQRGARGARTDAIQKFDDGHICAEAPPNGAHLEADDAAADHDQGLGDRCELEAARRGHDRLLVHRHAVEFGRLRASRDHDVLRRERLRRATVHRVALDRASAHNLAGALEVVDLVLLEQALDAARQAGHRLVLVRHQLRKVDLDVIGRDAVRPPAVRGLLVQVRGVQERL